MAIPPVPKVVSRSPSAALAVGRKDNDAAAINVDNNIAVFFWVFKILSSNFSLLQARIGIG